MSDISRYFVKLKASAATSSHHVFKIKQQICSWFTLYSGYESISISGEKSNNSEKKPWQPACQREYLRHLKQLRKAPLYKDYLTQLYSLYFDEREK
jgi:hypothetical protein